MSTYFHDVRTFVSAFKGGWVSLDYFFLSPHDMDDVVIGSIARCFLVNPYGEVKVCNALIDKHGEVTPEDPSLHDTPWKKWIEEAVLRTWRDLMAYIEAPPGEFGEGFEEVKSRGREGRCELMFATPLVVRKQE